ncbi:MAG: hypothetical protein K9N00_06955, partial [Candidatus Marinimicrobia bacterium]|nr:hypothetical protein [Candidatus Neomarinimicrobiota bacterium]
MLKYYVCVIFLVLTCINLNATANITIKDIFCKTYTEKSDAYFNGMSEIKNNKIAISGVYHENKDNQIATVIGNNGEIIWQDFRDPGWDHARFRSCIILENLDIIFGGMQNAQGTNYFDPIFVKYDSAGTEIDYKNIDLPGTNDIRTIVQLSNKNIAYLGKNEPDKQFVGLIDSNLQEIKRNEFDCYSDFQQLTTILPDKNNNLYAVGAYNGNKPGIIKFDSDLNLLWGKTVNDNENREVYSANLYKNEIVLGGQDTDDSLAYLIKTDTSGNQIWERTISPNSYSNSKVMGIKFHNSYILVTVRDYSNDIKTIQRLNVYNLEGDQIESYILFNSEPFTNYPGWNGKSIVSNENNIYISGYIINNDTRIPALTKVNISIEDSFLDSLSWYIRVQASTNNYNDDYNYIGVAKNATNLFDSNFDEVEPPPPPENYTSIYLPHPEWDTTLGDKFSKDIRPEISLKDTMQVWYFDFFTTEGGEAKLDFLFNDIPEVPVVLENLETKERTNISNKNTYSFESIADSIYSFRISIGDTTAPDLKLGKSCNGPAILISDSIHNFKWMTNDGYRVDSVKIWFTSDSGETYKEINRQNYIDSYNWMVIDTTVTYGNLLKISSKDYAGNEKIKVSERPFAIIGDSLSNHIFEGWNLWGVPLIPKKDSIENIIGDDFTDYWVTYEYKNNGYTNNDVFQLGKGYWLGNVESAILDIIGEPIQKDTSISLNPGWNLFSNPLILNIDKDSLIFIKDGVSKKTVEAVSTGWVNNIYRYNKNSYTTPTTIEPFQGYWISVLGPYISMKFPIHRQSNKGINKLASNEWRINFRAKTKTAQDN